MHLGVVGEVQVEGVRRQAEVPRHRSHHHLVRDRVRVRVSAAITTCDRTVGVGMGSSAIVQISRVRVRESG